jgi:hypothetical protein
MASLRMRTICGPVAEGMAISTRCDVVLAGDRARSSPVPRTGFAVEDEALGGLGLSSIRPMTSILSKWFWRSSHNRARPAAPAP